MTKRMLNTAEPTIVPVPTSPLATNTPKMAVNSSGALEPAAINVAPATSWDRLSRYRSKTPLDSVATQHNGRSTHLSTVFERWQEVVITDDRQTVEHVADDRNVND